MLEKNFNELDRDFIITWSNFMSQCAGDLFYLGINFYKPDTVKAITRLAELGQINALQSYYNLNLDPNNIEVKKRIIEIEQKYSNYEKDNIITNQQQKNFGKVKPLIDVANYLNFNEAFALYSYYNNLYEKGIKSRKFSKVNIDDDIKTYHNNKDKYYKLTCELAQREYAETNDWHILERMNEMFHSKHPKGYVARHFLKNQALGSLSGREITKCDLELNTNQQLLDAFTMAKNVYFFNPGINNAMFLSPSSSFFKKGPKVVHNAIEILGQISNLPLSKNMDGIKLDYIHTQKDEDEELTRMINCLDKIEATYYDDATKSSVPTENSVLSNISSPRVEDPVLRNDNANIKLGVNKTKNTKVDTQTNPTNDGMGGEGK